MLATTCETRAPQSTHTLLRVMLVLKVGFLSVAGEIHVQVVQVFPWGFIPVLKVSLGAATG